MLLLVSLHIHDKRRKDLWTWKCTSKQPLQNKKTPHPLQHKVGDIRTLKHKLEMLQPKTKAEKGKWHISSDLKTCDWLNLAFNNYHPQNGTHPEKEQHHYGLMQPRRNGTYMDISDKWILLTTILIVTTIHRSFRVNVPNNHWCGSLSLLSFWLFLINQNALFCSLSLKDRPTFTEL